jgi:hypothetical protein
MAATWDSRAGPFPRAWISNSFAKRARISCPRRLLQSLGLTSVHFSIFDLSEKQQKQEYQGRFAAGAAAGAGLSAETIVVGASPTPPVV